jgi:hypothetical protein
MLAPPFSDLHGCIAPYNEKPTVTQAFCPIGPINQADEQPPDGDPRREIFRIITEARARLARAVDRR